jgi:hypothetical protein
MKNDVNNSLFESSSADESNYINDESSFIDSELTKDSNSLGGLSLTEKRNREQAKKNIIARKRIDELKEKKRLKDLLDDSEDW